MVFVRPCVRAAKKRGKDHGPDTARASHAPGTHRRNVIILPACAIPGRAVLLPRPVKYPSTISIFSLFFYPPNHSRFFSGTPPKVRKRAVSDPIPGMHTRVYATRKYKKKTNEWPKTRVGRAHTISFVGPCNFPCPVPVPVPCTRRIFPVRHAFDAGSGASNVAILWKPKFRDKFESRYSREISGTSVIHLTGMSA